MALKEVKYSEKSGGGVTKMTHCPMCGDELCGNGWAYHIEVKPECRETAYNRVEELASGTHRRDIETRQDEPETRQVTL